MAQAVSTSGSGGDRRFVYVVASVAALGGLLFGYDAGVIGALSDRLGRRTIILVAATIFAIGAVGAGLSPNVETLVFFRFWLGLGVGSASALVPSYISESAPTDVRGSLSSLFQLAITIGILVA